MITANKISIVGAGSVGAAIAYAILLRQICSEVILVDVNQEKCKAEVSDLQDGLFLTNTQVKFGTMQEAGSCDMIVITAGAKQKDGETRVQLIDRNFGILNSIISGLKPIKESAILLLVSNPVDVLTYFAQKLSGLAKEQVFGSGTFLDTCRLRNALAARANIADTAVHAYVLVVAWSSAHIGTAPLLDYDEFKSEEHLNEIAEKTKNKAYEIIKTKGATYFGIAAVVSSIAETVFMNQRNIRPLSVYHEDFKCCISVPVVLGRGGVQKLVPIPLSDCEKKKLKESAESLRKIIDKYEPTLEEKASK